MGIPVLILGESGSGKSASLRNFDPAEVGIFNVAGKPLPFRKKMRCITTSDYNVIAAAISRGSCKAYVIDDSQYLMAFEAFSKVNVKGFEKFTQMAINFYNLVQYIIRQTPDDCIVYFLHHVDQDSNTGKIKAKTQGKMLDSQLTLEGLFTIVLMTIVDKGHWFVTQSDGMTPCKSPMEMFPDRVDNDLKAVDTAIRGYYEF